ncbi:DUF4861 domain-containing protein [Neolewinella aurantiaca]|uniref:DUF4861 domain-containing protein n=1 Tax=Neolewinella aurantiaca TaxID=2602767 RepID=A0A5C7FV76_9BACT|nr:DUF4861 family protein [Neolewinella aurantiaca]TXF90252.1 DUF4861 domain-containing protein [Neolewinella aurantiaca]
MQSFLQNCCSLLFLVAITCGCQPSNPTGNSDTEQPDTGSHLTQALLLIQKMPFDLNDKNKVDGPYQQRKQVTIPSDLPPQNKWVMFEGPVLENDKVAYRFYADSRHRFDIYGKRVPDLVMDTVSWKYHDIMDWGSDILKVGNSLGLGSPAVYFQDSVYTFSNCDTKTIEVIETGGEKSMIRTTFKGLLIGGKTMDIVQDWTIEAGDYYSTIDLYMPEGVKLPDGMRFATGIVSLLPEVTSGTANGFDYLMNWGKQSFHKEGMGMAVMAKAEYGPQAIEDELSHLLVFDATEKVSYRFMAVWERDQSQTTNATDFKEMVEAATK